MTKRDRGNGLVKWVMETVVVVVGWVGHVGNPQGVVQALCEQGVMSLP